MEKTDATCNSVDRDLNAHTCCSTLSIEEVLKHFSKRKETLATLHHSVGPEVYGICACTFF